MFLILLFLLSISGSILSMEEGKLPLVYHRGYNIGLCGIEKLHPFPAGKYGEVHKQLKETFNLDNEQFYKPEEPSTEILQKVHSKAYLDSLNN